MARLSNNKKRKIRLLTEQAYKQLQAGALDMCEHVCRQVEALHPDEPELDNIRGLMASRLGRAQDAIRFFRRAVDKAPRRAEFHVNLAGLLLSAGQADEALSHYCMALRRHPGILPAQLGKASALVALGRHQEAIAELEPLQRRRPRDTDLMMRLFRACYHAGDTDKAEQWLRRVLELEPEHSDAHYSLALLLLERGDVREGEGEVRAALRARPDHADAAVLLAELKRFEAEPDAHDIALLANMYQQAEEGSPERARLGFAYGKVLDDLGRVDEAFACIHEANEIAHKHSEYNADAELAHLEAIIAAYTPEVLQHAAPNEEQTPIFIVGMPRCGSTLVEQILASHPDVAPRGECSLFEETLWRIGRAQGAPLTLDNLGAYTPEQWQALGEQYLHALRTGVSPAVKRITDKTLSNIRFVGAIHCAFPHARIIHVRRDPMDTCWSIYRHHLLGPLFDYGRNLGELGYYYRMYQRLMAHWRSILPQGTMYELDYEQLVAEPERQIRDLLAACELPFDERCLRYYETDTDVRTASFMQVRRPMNDGSIGAWRPYAKHLAPLMKILGVH